MTITRVLSILFWLAYIANEVLGAAGARFWANSEAILWSALLFGVWAIAAEVRDVGRKREAQEQTPP